MISDSFPTDLILEILLRLPAKSIARFHCVSKLWVSILRCPHFTELFLTRSSAQPRLLFAIENNYVWSFFSLPLYEKSSLPIRQSLYEKSSLSLLVDADFHMKFPPDNMRICNYPCGYTSGLIIFRGLNDNGMPVICNPITGRYAALPSLESYRINSFSFLGFDPIDKQFKVLFPDHHKILTLGTGKMRWRKIECSLTHGIVGSAGICINGVLYYLGYTYKEMTYFVIVCFDVRSEKFKSIYPESFCQLINYKGKLGVIYDDSVSDGAFELRLWVLEDVEKQEWSKYAYTLKDDKLLLHKVAVDGVTATGEIVLSSNFTHRKLFYVFYYNLERNTLKRVEIQGFGEHHEDRPNFGSSVYVFADHVEDLNVNETQLLKSSIYAPYVKTEEEESKSEEGEDEEESGEK